MSNLRHLLQGDFDESVSDQKSISTCILNHHVDEDDSNDVESISRKRPRLMLERNEEVHFHMAPTFFDVNPKLDVCSRSNVEYRAHTEKLTKGKQKIPIEFIHDRARRYSTFSKRKTGMMKKAVELAELTGAEVLLLIASETNHVYTYATKRLRGIIDLDCGKELIKACLSTDLDETDEMIVLNECDADSSSDSVKKFEQPNTRQQEDQEELINQADLGITDSTGTFLNGQQPSSNPTSRFVWNQGDPGCRASRSSRCNQPIPIAPRTTRESTEDQTTYPGAQPETVVLSAVSEAVTHSTVNPDNVASCRTTDANGPLTCSVVTVNDHVLLVPQIPPDPTTISTSWPSISWYPVNIVAPACTSTTDGAGMPHNPGDCSTIHQSACTQQSDVCNTIRPPEIVVSPLARTLLPKKPM